MFNFGTTELVIIGAVIVLLFGGRKIPELAKGLAQGIKSFKKEIKTPEDKQLSDSPSKPDEK